MGLLLISALTHECRLSTGNAAESTGWSGGSHRRADVSDLRLAMGSRGRSDGVPRLCCHGHVVVEHACPGSSHGVPACDA